MDYRKQFDAENPAPEGFWEDAYIAWLERQLEAADNKNRLHEMTIMSMRDEIANLRCRCSPTMMSPEEEAFWDKVDK